MIDQLLSFLFPKQESVLRITVSRFILVSWNRQLQFGVELIESFVQVNWNNLRIPLRDDTDLSILLKQFADLLLEHLILMMQLMNYNALLFLKLLPTVIGRKSFTFGEVILSEFEFVNFLKRSVERGT